MGRGRAATRRGPARAQAGLTLDAGALIALERGDRTALVLVRAALAHSARVAVPAGVLAQVWRGGRRQFPIQLLLADDGVDVPALDVGQALSVGALLAETGTTDVVDASVAAVARARGDAVVTSDPADLARLAPHLPTIVV